MDIITMTSHEGHVVSNHWLFECLFNSSCRLTSKKHQSPHYWAFVRGIHWWLVNFLHEGPVMQKKLPFDDILMIQEAFLITFLCHHELIYFNHTSLGNQCRDVTNQLNLDCLFNSLFKLTNKENINGLLDIQIPSQRASNAMSWRHHVWEKCFQHFPEGWFDIKCCLTSIWILIVEVRQFYSHLISTMGLSILMRRHLYIEPGPRKLELSLYHQSPPWSGFIVRRAGLLWSQQYFEWRWSVPLFKCLTVLEFSFILFDLCLLITFFNFIMNYVPIVTFWIFTYHKIWILSIMFCFIWSYWIIYFLACLEVSWRVVS